VITNALSLFGGVWIVTGFLLGVLLLSVVNNLKLLRKQISAHQFLRATFPFNSDWKKDLPKENYVSVTKIRKVSFAVYAYLIFSVLFLCVFFAFSKRIEAEQVRELMAPTGQ